MDERLLQLDALAELAKIDVETYASLRTFLPLWRHSRSLSAETLIVLGARGSGKTALFKLVRDTSTPGTLQSFFNNYHIPEASWIDAFSQDNMNHPDVGVMEQFGQVAGDIALRAFWVGHLLRVARNEIQGLKPLPEVIQTIVDAPPNNLAAWVPLAETNLGMVFTALDDVNKHLAAEGRTVVALYDYLDRIAQFAPNTRRRYIRALLSLWLSLTNRYKQLRGKIFLRDDLFQATEIDFTDANKLRARAETLEWKAEDLYRVIARQLLNLQDPRHTSAMQSLLSEVPGLNVKDLGDFGLMPSDMAGDIYQAFVTRLAGRVIGRGIAKVATYNWILSRLQDGHKRITPRAMMWFLGYAAEAARGRPPGRFKALFSAEDLLQSLRRTSKDRAREVLEEDKLAVRLENLRGKEVPYTRQDVMSWLGARRKDEQPGIPEDGAMVLDELLRLGLLRQDEDDPNRIDVPDIFRYGFDIGPDYATAWRDLLVGNESAARNAFIREPQIMGEILRRLNVQWGAIGEDELKRGDVAGARVVCERALQGAQSTGDPLAEADALVRLATIDLMHLNNYERAKGEYLRALPLVQKAHDSLREVGIRWWLAGVEWSLKDLPAARGHCMTSVNLSKELGNFVCLSFSHLLLGKLHEIEGNHEEALQAYLRSLSSSRLAANAWIETQAWELLAGLAAHHVRHEFAIQFFALAHKPYDGPSHGLDVEALSKQALAEYERDKGHALLSRAFPDADLTALG